MCNRRLDRQLPATTLGEGTAWLTPRVRISRPPLTLKAVASIGLQVAQPHERRGEVALRETRDLTITRDVLWGVWRRRAHFR
eukprot:scaffold3270_cov106-Phaeocystis_antarctica.AAC.5